MRCPTCRLADVTEISLTLKGSSVTMHSCTRCETRWWDQDGQKVALPQVLHLATP
ncbi:MAG TPA: hypothetical protein VHH09_05345 [Acidimicrobiales bacterium]|nr:hypothetical protein [Acidimicrobiales bacterium]